MLFRFVSFFFCYKRKILNQSFNNSLNHITYNHKITKIQEAILKPIKALGIKGIFTQTLILEVRLCVLLLSQNTLILSEQQQP